MGDFATLEKQARDSDDYSRDAEKALDRLIDRDREAGYETMTSQRDSQTTTSAMTGYNSRDQTYEWHIATEERLDAFEGRTNNAVVITRTVEPSQITGLMATDTKRTFFPVGSPFLRASGGALTETAEGRCPTSTHIKITGLGGQKFCVPNETFNSADNEDRVKDLRRMFDDYFEQGPDARTVTHLDFNTSPEDGGTWPGCYESADWPCYTGGAIANFAHPTVADAPDGAPNSWLDYDMANLVEGLIDNLEGSWEITYEAVEYLGLRSKFGVPPSTLLLSNQTLTLTLNKVFLDMSNKLLNTQIESGYSFKRVKQKVLTSQMITPTSLMSRRGTVSVVGAPDPASAEAAVPVITGVESADSGGPAMSGGPATGEY